MQLLTIQEVVATQNTLAKFGRDNNIPVENIFYLGTELEKIPDGHWFLDVNEEGGYISLGIKSELTDIDNDTKVDSITWIVKDGTPKDVEHTLLDIEIGIQLNTAMVRDYKQKMVFVVLYLDGDGLEILRYPNGRIRTFDSEDKARHYMRVKMFEINEGDIYITCLTL